MSITLQSIRRENISSVFQSIALHDMISRSAVSEETGLSLMTVGKAADALLSHGAIVQAKTPQNHAGRRAGFLSVNAEKYFLIFDFSTPTFGTCLFNLHLLQTPVVPSSSAENPLVSEKYSFHSVFSSTVELLSEKYAPKDCCGIGIVLPHHTVSEQTTAQLLSEAEEQFGPLPIFADSHIHSAARSFAREIPNFEKKNILYWYIDSALSAGAYVVCGDVLLGQNRRFCDFGAMHNFGGCTLSDLLRKNDDTDLADLLAQFASNILSVLSPHNLILSASCTDEGHKIKEIGTPLASQLIQKHGFSSNDLPEITNAVHSAFHVRRGLAIELRKKWLARISDIDLIS